MANSLRPSQRPRSILIVDDDDIVLVGLRATLKRDGYDVVVARSGYAAVDALARQHFGLVITDLMMPGLSGIGVLEEALRLSPETRVVVLSGYPRRSAADEALRKGAAAFLLKPIDHARLRETVDAQMSRGSDAVK
jgi:DNA-binding NtrC family response regulator